MVFVPDKIMSFPIEKAPELASRIGIIAVHSSFMEEQMEGLFCHLTALNRDKGSMVFAEIAGRRRRDILSNMLSETEPRDIADALIAMLNKEVKNCFNLRNKIVHEMFVATSATKMTELKSLSKKQPVHHTVKSLDENILYFAKTNAAFHWLSLALLHPSLAKPE
jgi:hypothetical protein